MFNVIKRVEDVGDDVDMCVQRLVSSTRLLKTHSTNGARTASLSKLGSL